MYLSIYLTIYLSINQSICLSASLKTQQFCEISSMFELDNIKNEAIPRTSSMFELDNVKNETILRDFFVFQSWQHQKRSNSARRPQFFNLTRSKTKQFCETSSFCKAVTTSKTKQFCETSFKNGKFRAALTASYHCVLRFFQSICPNYCACHDKVMPGHTKCCTCHAKSS